MTLQEILKFDWVEQKYPGIIEICPKRAGNHYVLELALAELQKSYNLMKITDAYIRGFKKWNQGV